MFNTPQSVLRFVTIASILSLLACADPYSPSPEARATPQQAVSMESAPDVASAILKNAAGQGVGSAKLMQRGNDIAVSITAMNLTPGAHGTHVHMTGSCTAPDFKSAAGHWNPESTQHGMHNPQGAHAGDLPNMDIGPDGTGALRFTIADVRISGGEGALMDSDGAVIVIHAGPDDMMSDPAGNAGGRVACGVITLNTTK